MLLRRAVTELAGTALLVAAVVGTGIMAARLSDDASVQLLANSLATGAALVALILGLQPVSASFNPVVTVARMFSDTFAGIAPASVPMFIVMQVVGGLLAVDLVRVLHPEKEKAHA